MSVNKYLLIILLIIAGCANRGTPTGGEIDTDPPIVLKSIPENFSSNFNSENIEIIFDEYIKLNNTQKELIISPPIDPMPYILPIGSASKILKISELDSLKENTTYSFHFGESIQDNNEKNPLSNYRYVFSTGNYIDSLFIKGSVYDAFTKEISENINVLLYEVDSLFTDSIIYKQKPKHVAKVIDSTNNYIIQNIKKGKYLVVALEEENKDYIFQSKLDKIGFTKEYIELPKDSIIDIKVFKETPPFKLGKPKQKTNRSFKFGYEGDYENFKIRIVNDDSLNYHGKITRDYDSDSLIYWLKTDKKLDSILFNVYNEKFSDTLKIKLRDKENDSLIIKSDQNKTLKFEDNFIIQANLPFEKINKEKIKVIDKDSLNIDFEIKLDSLANQYNFIFEKQEEQEYRIELMPGALTDYYENINDSLFFKARTRTYNDYGNLSLNLKNAVFPIIIELVNSRGQVKYETYSINSSSIEFNNIDPGKYFIRITFDKNQNKKFDSGNFLNRIFPERVVYYPDEIDVRAGWDLVQEFILQ